MSALAAIACAVATAVLLAAVGALLFRRPDPHHEFMFRLIQDLLSEPRDTSREFPRA